jgi:fumarylacetoacetate (FAA) hydrolase
MTADSECPIHETCNTYDGTCDAQHAIVSCGLKTAHISDGIAPTLQAALDDSHFIAPQLAALYGDLNADRARRPFEFRRGIHALLGSVLGRLSSTERR